MSTSNQQTLTDSEANKRPPMLEKGNYIPWESGLRRPMIPNPDKPTEQILEPLSKMIEGNKKQYIADVRFEKFEAKEGESLESVYERLTTLVNIMDRNNVHTIPVSINTKFLNCLQPEWRKYVTMVRDSQEDKLTTAMMLLARAITQKFSTPTNNRLRTSSNIRNQAVIQDDRFDIQTKNAGYGGNGNRNAGRLNRNPVFNAGTRNDESNQIVHHVPQIKSNPRKANVQCYNYNEKGHCARDCQKLRVRDAKYFREQLLLAMKDEAGRNLKDEENDFILDNFYGDETLEELTAAVIMMARIQSADDNVASEQSYDAKVASEVNASTRVHEQVNCVQRKTIIHTSDDDQIDSNIIFDDPYEENNGGTSEHDSTAHDEYHDIKMLTENVHREAENKKTIKQ
ncbi:retrovirus-related pol polyprotein from transposon TNT 1-94 [Tanacetum coccineum]